MIEFKRLISTPRVCSALLSALILGCSSARTMTNVSRDVAADSAPGVDAPSVSKTIRSAIIFIPGFYGSALREKGSKDRFFITAGEYLFGSRAVSLHVQDLKTPTAPDLEVDGVLSGVRLLPGIYTYNVYGRFLDNLSKIAHDTGQKFVPFAYDWRQDISESARELNRLVERLHAEGITKIQIVAHSMGCLVTAYYLGYGDQSLESAQLNWSGAHQVQRAVLMAGPFGGAFVLFRNMQTGAMIGSNSSYMPAETVASLPSSYQLLPFRSFHLLSHDEKQIEFDVSDPELWKRHHLGLMRDSTLEPRIIENRATFLSAQLTRAKTFSEKILLKTNSTNPPPATLQILQLVGAGHSVVNSAYWDSKSDQFEFDNQDLDKHHLPAPPLFLDGDGSVTLESAVLPQSLQSLNRIMHSTRIHEKIFEDEEFQKALPLFLK